MNKTFLLGALALTLSAVGLTATAEAKDHRNDHRNDHRYQPHRKQVRKQVRHDRRQDRRQERRHEQSLDRLADRVESILHRDAILRRYHLRASANSSYITVSGAVNTYNERDRAMGLARLSSNGVSVRSSIRVR